MYVLVSHYTRSIFAGFWAAITLAFCPYVIMNSCYFLHFASVWFFPWFIFLFWKFLGYGKLKYGIGSAIIYALCLFEDQTYFFLLSLLALSTCVFFSLRKRKTTAFYFLRNSAISVALFLAIASWYLAGLVRQAFAAQAKFPVWPDPAIDYFSLHAGGLLRPSCLLATYRAIPYLASPIMVVTNVFIGYAPLFFACLALLQFNTFVPYKKKTILFWLITAAAFCLLSAGPLVFGNIPPLKNIAPYNLVCVGPLRQFRIPVRFAFVAIMSIYIIAGFGVERFLKMKRLFIKSDAIVATFLIILQGAEFLPASYPLLDLSVPCAYIGLNKKDKGTPLLVLPLGWQTSYKTVGCYNKETQYFQTIHEHPIFQGQIARIDDRYIEYYTSQPGFRYLMEAHFREPTPAERIDVVRILRDYGIKNVVISKKYFDPKCLHVLENVFHNFILSNKLQLLLY